MIMEIKNYSEPLNNALEENNNYLIYLMKKYRIKSLEINADIDLDEITTSILTY